MSERRQLSKVNNRVSAIEKQVEEIVKRHVHNALEMAELKLSAVLDISEITISIRGQSQIIKVKIDGEVF